jgi:glycosyltransferase involved in cell wall biosynthesis
LKIVLFANTDWYLYNFRRSLAEALIEHGHDVLLLSPPGPYGDKLTALGLRWLPAPMDRRSLNPLREARLLLWLAGLIRQERPDVVHGFTIKCAVYGALAARVSGAGRVSAVTGMGYVFISKEPKARLLAPIVRRLMRLALGGRRGRVILQNPDDLQFFAAANIVPADQIRLIQGSGVDCARFLPAPDGAPRSSPRLRVVLIARMLWDKGVAEFAEAACLLHAEGRDIDCLLVGDADPGNPASVPDATLQAWRAEGAVRWLGHVDDMPALLQSADIVVLPSYREGLPKSLIEAAACAKPLVAADVPGCREVVTHEVDGLLVPVRDGPALARAIARLQDDPALAARLGAAAREKALALFDERIVIAQTLAVYDEVVQQGH